MQCRLSTLGAPAQVRFKLTEILGVQLIALQNSTFTLLTFKTSPTSFHCHLPFHGRGGGSGMHQMIIQHMDYCPWYACQRHKSLQKSNPWEGCVKRVVLTALLSFWNCKTMHPNKYSFACHLVITWIFPTLWKISFPLHQRNNLELSCDPPDNEKWHLWLTWWWHLNPGLLTGWLWTRSTPSWYI